MNEFDNLFSPPELSGFDIEAWKEKKQKERTTVYSMLNEMTMIVANDGNSFQKYLDIQSRFIHQSVSNVLLISAQFPTATQLFEFNDLKSKGGYIHKNETGIYLLKRGDEYKRKDGTTGINYTVTKYFDISQVTGIPSPVTLPLSDNMRLKAEIETASVRPVIIDNLHEEIDARYLPERRIIQVKRGLKPDYLFRILAQELAHMEMDNGDGTYSRASCAFPAYAVSYMLCQRYGVSTQSYQFDRAVDQFQDMDAKEVRNKLNVLRNVNRELASRMDRSINFQRSQQAKKDAPVR